MSSQATVAFACQGTQALPVTNLACLAKPGKPGRAPIFLTDQQSPSALFFKEVYNIFSPLRHRIPAGVACHRQNCRLLVFLWKSG